MRAFVRATGLAAGAVLLVTAAPASAGLTGYVKYGPFASGAAPAVTAATAACPGEGVCHFVSVPLNRDNPAGAKIRIRYEVYAHTDRSRPPLPPIFLTEGGPGASIINDQFAHPAWVGMLTPLRNRHDIVLVDQRGVGGSGAINCPALQAGVGNLFDAAAQCARQLGFRSDLYGSADIAADIDAIRRALGARKIDFFGSSFATMDIQAYAIRYPGRLQTAVLDSSVSPRLYDPSGGSEAVLRTVTQLCMFSGSCAISRLHPAREVAWLARRLRAHPLDGVGVDDTGGRHRIHLTEGWLVFRVLQSGAAFTSQSEVAAAAVALRRGDTRPLLRLAAENDFPPSLAGGDDPTVFSAGDSDARACTDLPFPWDRNSPIGGRQAQFQGYLDSLPANTVSPFSVDAWFVPYPIGIGPTECIRWPAPPNDRPLAVPAGSRFPDTPVLVLSGGIDQITTTGDHRVVAEQWPNSKLLLVPGSGHDTTLNASSECVQAIVVRFFRTRSTGDTSCVRTPEFVFPTMEGFPMRLAGEVQALHDPSGVGDHSTALDRKAVSSAWHAIRDTIWHQFVFGNFPPATAPGLRGGTVGMDIDFDTFTVTATFHGVRFTSDLAVTGTVTLNGINRLDGQVTLSGAVHGSLRLTGLWLRPGATTLRVRGTINGRHIAVRVPGT
jgi:pimeloyl-ACP methyl ester carboxylesterase